MSPSSVPHPTTVAGHFPKYHVSPAAAGAVSRPVIRCGRFSIGWKGWSDCDHVHRPRGITVQSGITRCRYAWRYLHLFARIGAEFGDREFLYYGRRFKVTGMDRATPGHQPSPFRDGTTANQEATVHNLDNGEKVSYSLLVPHMIERYGFYEGQGTPYRVEPRNVVEVLDFLKRKGKR